MSRRILPLIFFLVLSGCGDKKEGPPAEGKNKIERAVEQVVTKEFKAYEGAKQSLEKINKETQEQREKEIK
ncbi:MAG: hypothetical protein HYY46_12470 [Deltaproteobacteria bacterium]|nr:hypothetical protein [Deltaproteobacteria bacterium]